MGAGQGATEGRMQLSVYELREMIVLAKFEGIAVVSASRRDLRATNARPQRRMNSDRACESLDSMVPSVA